MSIMGGTVFLQTLIKLDSQNLSAGSCVKIVHIQIVTFYYSFKYHSMRMILFSGKIHFCCFRILKSIVRFRTTYTLMGKETFFFFHTLIECSHQK